MRHVAEQRVGAALDLAQRHLHELHVLADLDVLPRHADVLVAELEEAADLHHHLADVAVAVDDDVLHVADFLALLAAHGHADHLARAPVVAVQVGRRGERRDEQHYDEGESHISSCSVGFVGERAPGRRIELVAVERAAAVGVGPREAPLEHRSS